MTDKRPSQRIARARRLYDAAYLRLIEAIREETGSGAVSVAEAARQARWSREYIGQLRAGTAGGTPPKRRTPREAGSVP